MLWVLKNIKIMLSYIVLSVLTEKPMVMDVFSFDWSFILFFLFINYSCFYNCRFYISTFILHFWFVILTLALKYLAFITANAVIAITLALIFQHRTGNCYKKIKFVSTYRFQTYNFFFSVYGTVIYAFWVKCKED